jgi:hypothetical protein
VQGGAYFLSPKKENSRARVESTLIFMSGAK